MIHWDATFDAKGKSDDEAKKIVGDIFIAGLKIIKQKTMPPEDLRRRSTAARALSARSILITGCSSGIGLASAREMKARGWRVFATARKPEDLKRLRDEVGVESLYLDYTEPDSIEEAARHVLEATDGRLSALFNNGAYGQPGAVEDLKPQVLRAQFEANVFGWHHLTSLLIPAMRAQKAGRIVFCSSVLGLVAAPYRGAYCASKFAIEALADALRHRACAFRHQGDPHRARSDRDPFRRACARGLSAEHRPRRLGRTGTSIALALPGSRRAAARRSSSGPRPWPPSWSEPLESKRPKPRYYVTVTTYAAALLRRILPTRALDAVAASN